MVFSSFVVNQHMSKNFHGMRNKATYKGLIWTAPAWARSGWCLEMISWRQPPIRLPIWYSLRTAVKSCIWSLPGGISVDNVQHNNLLGWGLGYFLCSKAEEQGIGVHCGESHLLVMSVAVYVRDKLLALKRSQVVFWLALCFTALWKTAEDHMIMFFWGLYRGGGGVGL